MSKTYTIKVMRKNGTAMTYTFDNEEDFGFEFANWCACDDHRLIKSWRTGAVFAPNTYNAYDDE